MVMRGLTWASIRKTPSLIPLFFVVGCGLCASMIYPLRCALKSPDVTWSRVRNPEPWNEYKNKQYKFYQTEKVPKSINIPEY